MRTTALRHKLPFHNRSLCENGRDTAKRPWAYATGARERACYEFVIDFQNALGRLYIRYFGVTARVIGVGIVHKPL